MNKYFNATLVLLIIILSIGICEVARTQQLSTELHAKLSASDQQKLRKADDLYAKGQQIENEAQSMGKEERKSQLKWLEAAECFQKANELRKDIYNSNVKSFWKKYTGEKNLLDFARKVEVAAADSFKKADQLRTSAEKERNLTDRIALLKKVYRLEGKSLIMMQKALFTYLSWPIEYDHLWVSTDDQKVPGETAQPVTKKPDSQPVKTKNEAKPDSVSSKKDTTTKNPSPTRIKATMIMVKPRSTIGSVPGKPSNTSVKDTISSSKPVTTIVKPVTTASTPVSKPVVQIPSKSVPVPNASEKKVSKDSIPKTTETRPVANVTNLPKKEKTSEVVVGNDSSLYGKMKVKEEQIDKFNDFLKKKYPSKMEDYVINFQELDYSDVNALREAWNRYQYGYLTEDTAAMLAVNKDTAVKVQQQPKDQKALTASNEKTKDIGVHKTSVKTGKDAVVKEEPSDVAVNTHKAGNKVTTVARKTATNEPVNMSTEGFVFRVQIVACRVQLDDNTLRGIYSGPLSVIELHEDGWYKYAIGEFTTYKQARQLRDKSTIPGVFVIAYLNGKRVKITPAIAYKRFSAKSAPSSLNPELIKYRIQIVSSKNTLSDTYIKNIYNGPVPVEIIKENGWNKYMLAGGKTFREANELLKKIVVPGAFIIAYHQETRIDIQTAIKLTDK